MARRTIVVSARTHLETMRLELARSGAGGGAKVTPIEGLAERLAGGFLTPINPDSLSRAVSEVLEAVTGESLGDLAAIRELPGLPRTLATSLRRAWNAGLELGEQADRSPRIAAMARIEAAVLERLPPGQLRPLDLVSKALENLAHAPVVLGAVQVRGVPDLARCWRRLVGRLTDAVPVSWHAGSLPVPAWVEEAGISVQRGKRKHPAPRTASCANPRHEVVEAMRWARSLMASGKAGPHEIAFAAASTTPYDDFFFSLGEECLLKVHYGHGRNALHTPEGQAAAALADVLLRGLSQERVRRLISRAKAHNTPAVASLPDDWSRYLPASAPLGTPGRWRLALEGGEKREVAAVILPIVDLLAKGTDAAEEAGGKLLRGAAKALWRRALAQAPATALDRELGGLRVQDPHDPAASLAWMPASSLASSPRPYVWLLGLNAQSWPRPASEDPLLPERLLGGFKLEETSISTADRVSFDAIMASTAGEVVRSFSRREAGGRRLGVSPLVADAPATPLYRTQIPAHAMSEPDRLMARPDEFGLREDAKLADGCWRDWRSKSITEHDGLIKHADHPAITAALARPQSAHSLTMLLRNPIGFMWVYALGMHAPDLDGDALSLDPRDFGTLVHEVLDGAVQDMASAGDAAWIPDTVAQVVEKWLSEVGERWEVERPIPPPLLWQAKLAEAGVLALNALLYPLEPLPGQSSYSEVAFGSARTPSGRPAPWRVNQAVPIPGTGLTIAGRMDRVDVASNGQVARVVDYKTGSRAGAFVLRGGRELQRCLYAFAVRSLLGDDVEIDAGLLYPSREPGNPGDGNYDALPETQEALKRLKAALAAAETNLRHGLALPGMAAGMRYQDVQNPKSNACYEHDGLIFALPVVPGTMLGPKKIAASQMLGTTITELWEAA